MPERKRPPARGAAESERDKLTRLRRKQAKEYERAQHNPFSAFKWGLTRDVGDWQERKDGTRRFAPDPTRTNVLLAYIAHADVKTGECHPSYRMIAAFARCSVRMAMRHTRGLVERGFLEKEPNTEPNGRQTPNKYRVCWEAPQGGKAVQPGAFNRRVREGGKAMPGEGGKAMPPGGGTAMPGARVAQLGHTLNSQENSHPNSHLNFQSEPTASAGEEEASTASTAPPPWRVAPQEGATATNGNGHQNGQTGGGTATPPSPVTGEAERETA